MEKKSTKALAVTAPAATPLPAIVTASGDNYSVRIPNTDAALVLVRDTDFGKIPGTSKPCLLKAGAEKILWGYGITTNVTVENAIERYDEDPFFFYRCRCECFKGDLLLTVGYGSANSRERQVGRQSPYDAANARLKIARKRALVDAALMVGQLSGAFAQDIENDDFMKEAEQAMTSRLPEDAPITQAQRKRLYGIAGAAGFSTEAAKAVMKGAGFASTSDIKQKDYDKVCALFTTQEGTK